MSTITAIDHAPPVAKMPGHWLLAKMDKRVLRPGGIELTRELLGRLGISQDDDVVEFAPGLGVTACLTLARKPHTYTAIERDRDAATTVERLSCWANSAMRAWYCRGDWVGRCIGDGRLW